MYATLHIYKIHEYLTERKDKECQQGCYHVITSLSQLISSLISNRQIIEVCGLVQLVDWLMGKLWALGEGVS